MASRPGTHFLDLPHAACVRTHAFRIANWAVADITAIGAMGIIHGPAGLGKTFAVRTGTQDVAVPVSWFDFPGRTSTKQLVRSLVSEITGVAHDGPRDILERALIDELERRPRLLIIDEAQRLYDEAIEYLRHLYDNPRTQIALLLVGGNDCWKRVSKYPMVTSRLYRRIAFNPLTNDEVLEHIPHFHPLYKTAPAQTLLRINDDFAHGTWRNWTAFTRTLLTLLDKCPGQPLDGELIDAALQLHGM